MPLKWPVSTTFHTNKMFKSKTRKRAATENETSHGKSLFHSPTFQDVHSKPSLTLSGRNETTSPILTLPLAHQIRTCLSPIFKEALYWNLLYSFDQFGVSLTTLFNNCVESQQDPCVIAIRDNQGHVFGAYMSELPKVLPKYYGNGLSFLWRHDHERDLFKVFQSTGKNEYYLNSKGNYLSIGAGGGIGIYIDEEFRVTSEVY